MKKRNPFLIFLLSFFTAGIYTIYWLYVIRRDLVRALRNERAIWPIWIIFAPLLAIVAVFALYVLAATILSFQNIHISTESAFMNTLVFLFGAAAIIAYIVMPIMWIHQFSKALAVVVRQNDASTLFGLWILFAVFGVSPIWNLLVQSDINKFLDSQAETPTPQGLL